MVKRDLEKEKQMELAAIWGSETDGDLRYPRRRRAAAKRPNAISTTSGSGNEEVEDDHLSDLGSDAISEDRASDIAAQKSKKAKKNKKTNTTYRLHCFIEPGTEKNAVRTVFEAYEPKVELRTSQKGNLLNKTHYAVLTFRNKAMALHAVKVLDGTNQYDLLGVKELKLRLMLSRKEHNAARQKMRKRLREERGRQLMEESNEDAEFIKNFLATYAPSVKNKEETQK
ncbi:uncharacterized protein TM35_000162540 [Trypanosoma theileri]|uniref:RRM domain-containing protein n=1 Tax=Trypanosoma theileri TaxID=67003 RepID=A0A1X0NV88_9TRYP|nr:uncharacterized protein TM35_000162540 [Trypanosoma theileri]ORC88616.1 hypothetical protein TM35_000162540 [Trypanosoma theileri]